MMLVIALPNAAANMITNKQINVMNAPTGILTKSLLIILYEADRRDIPSFIKYLHLKLLQYFS